jgi:alpha-1,3-mannosyltransferase
MICGGGLDGHLDPPNVNVKRPLARPAHLGSCVKNVSACQFKTAHKHNLIIDLDVFAMTVTTLQNFYITLAGQRWDAVFVTLLLIAEVVLGALIIYKVPYTEIDWIAYMQEVDFWLDGEYDYRKIYGNTGPLVYPAGFLYLFGALQWMTGREIPTAQIFFLFFYVATQGVVLKLYSLVLQEIRRRQEETSSLSPIQASHAVWSFRVAMGCLCISKRFHSIFLLRLFNDGPTMLVAYLSIWCFMKNRWNLGCFLFSIAVSLKMNVLLFAPGLLYLLIQESPKWTIPRLAICGFTQVIIGAPFLFRHPVSYLRKAFELDRQFFYKWTVNWKFLPEDAFLSKPLAVVLLTLHLSLLGAYFVRVYKSGRKMSGEHVVSTLFVSNFIGICCARTLHYQFYCWYFSSLPFMLWRGTTYPLPLRLVLLLGIEYAFLTFPATTVSSAVLQVAQWSIVIPCIFGAPLRSSKEATKEG